MSRILALCFALALPLADAADPIRPVSSWDDYRERLKEQGMSDSEADAEIISDLLDLKNMDRAAGDDRVGVAAPPFQFDAWFHYCPTRFPRHGRERLY